jgi:hypothetical protein
MIVVNTRQHEIMKRIMREVYKAVEKLGGDFEILGPIGSYGDSMGDEAVLASLVAWNAAYGPTADTEQSGISSRQTDCSPA